MTKITMSEAASKAFAAVVADAGGASLHLQIDAQFQNELFFGPSGPGDIEVRVNGLPLLIDRSSAPRARRCEHRLHRRAWRRIHDQQPERAAEGEATERTRTRVHARSWTDHPLRRQTGERALARHHRWGTRPRCGWSGVLAWARPRRPYRLSLPPWNPQSGSCPTAASRRLPARLQPQRRHRRLSAALLIYGSSGNRVGNYGSF